MKVLFEVVLNAKNRQNSRFVWLNNANNWLFIIEDGKRMRTLSTDPKPGKELQSTALTDTKICTSLSWNRDGTLLAMVVDKRQIYFWDIKTNKFTHYKPVSKISTSNVPPGLQNKSKEVNFIVWSKLTNRLIICYAAGQLILCDCAMTISDRAIKRSDGVFKQVSWIKSSAHADMFVCVTVSSELLVMNYDGEPKYYTGIGDTTTTIVRARLSPTSLAPVPGNRHHEGPDFEPHFEEHIWLAFQTADGRIMIKRIFVQNDSLFETTSAVDIAYANEDIDSQLVDFHWLSPTHLIACFASGVVDLLQIRSVIGPDKESIRFELTAEQVLDINREEEMNSNDKSNQIFKSFKLRSHSSSSKDDLTSKSMRTQACSFSLATISSYKLYYYEIVEVEYPNRFAFEKVDDLNLTISLSKLKLELEQVKWSFDCSMLAVQLNNCHILVYRTRLLEHMIALHGSRAAYLSGPNELTILNYSNHIDSSDHKSGESSNQKQESQGETHNDYALIINVALKPSVIAIGPKHLAVSLNNRIQFYLTDALGKRHELDTTGSGDRLDDEQEYVSIVVAISLNSRFVAVLFDDGRLKLHAIQSKTLMNEKLDPQFDNLTSVRADISNPPYYTDERFFPDPSEPEQISAFTLTEDLLLYCTQQCNLNVFSLIEWTSAQTCQHSKHFTSPIIKLRSNEQENKFICLLDASNGEDDNVFLYDLFYNQMVRFVATDLISRIFTSQLVLHLPVASEAQIELNKIIAPPPSSTTTTRTTSVATSTNASAKIPIANARPRLRRVMDAIWDSDGKTVLLIEQKCIHIFVTLDHTLEREDTLIWYVKTANKPSSYTVLYASQGIVSFQTALGRVINSILDSHDDEPRLVKLEQQIALLKEKVATAMKTTPDSAKGEEVESDGGLNDLNKSGVGDGSLLREQAEVMALKLDYLRSILPLYSLTKCKEICEHLMSEEVFNLMPREKSCPEIDGVIWRQLASWSLFTLNLAFASLIYRKHGRMPCAQALIEIIRDARNKRLDAREVVKMRLLDLLNCS